jgi:hypothetical protein
MDIFMCKKKFWQPLHDSHSKTAKPGLNSTALEGQESFWEAVATIVGWQENHDDSTVTAVAGQKKKARNNLNLGLHSENTGL